MSQLHQAKNKTTSGIKENFLAFNMNFSLKNGEQKVKSCVRAAFVPKPQQKLWITPGLWDVTLGLVGRVWEQGWCLIIQLDNGVGVGTARASLPNNSLFLQFVIVVVDSTDRERISVTKEELYKMLAHEVSAPCVFNIYLILILIIWLIHAKGGGFTPWTALSLLHCLLWNSQ